MASNDSQLRLLPLSVPTTDASAAVSTGAPPLASVSVPDNGFGNNASFPAHLQQQNPFDGNQLLQHGSSYGQTPPFQSAQNFNNLPYPAYQTPLHNQNISVPFVPVNMQHLQYAPTSGAPTYYTPQPHPPTTGDAARISTMDEENQNHFDAGASFGDKQVRRRFISKVFGILGVQLFFSFGVVLFFSLQ